MAWEKPKGNIYAYSEPGGERGEVNEWIQVTEVELREFEFSWWIAHQKMFGKTDFSWEIFIDEWISEHDAIVLHEGDINDDDRGPDFYTEGDYDMADDAS